MENLLLSTLMFSVLALSVLFFRKFWAKQYSRRLARALWIIVILRMLIPFNPISERSLIKLPRNPLLSTEITAKLPVYTGEKVIQPVDATTAEPSHGEMFSSDSGETDLVVPTIVTKTTTISFEQIAFSIWLTGFVSSLAIVGWSYIKFRTELKKKIQKVDGKVLERIQKELGREVKVYSVKTDESPMVIGVFNPAIVLPQKLLSQADEHDLSKQLKFVLQHEYSHILNNDLVIKLFYLIGRSFHWFNPLVYIIESSLNEDIEMATDEKVAKTLDEGQRTAYCLSILEVAEALPSMADTFSSRFTGDLESMKKRISSLFNKNQMRHGRMVLIVVLLIATLTIGLVGCEMPSPTEAAPNVLETETSEPTIEPAAPTEVTEEPTDEATAFPEVVARVAPTNPAPPEFPTNIDPNEQVLIEGGTFWMGCDEANNADLGCRSSELPRHEVTLDAFMIDRYEVTNGQYQLCVDAGICPAQKSISDDVYAVNPDPGSVSNYPVVGVTHTDAEIYCNFVGKRLPTEAEWEMAASGASETVFPWGDEKPDCTQANSLNHLNATDCVGGLMPVGSYPAGASSYGVMDMAGNVWEWVADVYDPGYYVISPATNPTGPESGDQYVVRGGGFSGNWSYLRNSARSYDLAFYSGADLGFRCAQDAK
jgi:formylglycine-generating enzyme required for sulfatase activity